MTFKNLEVTLSIKLITWSPFFPVHGGLRILLSCTCNGTYLPLVETSPDGTSGKEPTCQCRRLKRLQFNPWVGKIPWRRPWKPIPVFLPLSHGQRSPAGYSPQVAKCQTRLKRLSTHALKTSLKVSLAFPDPKEYSYPSAACSACTLLRRMCVNKLLHPHIELFFCKAVEGHRTDDSKS